MGDDLVIGGSGSVAVGTDDLFACAEQSRRLAATLSAMSRDAAWVSLLVHGGPALSPAAADAVDRLRHVRLLLAQAEVQSRGIDTALRAAADGYGFAEHFVGHLASEFTGGFSAIMARFAPLVLLATVGGVAMLGAAGGLVLDAASKGGLPGTPGSSRRPTRTHPGTNTAGKPSAGTTPAGASTVGESQAGWAQDKNEILTNRATVELVRLTAGSSGDVVAGLSGVPAPLASIVAGSGVPLGAVAIMNTGSVFGALKETPVRLVDSHRQEVTEGPSGFAERLSRVPDTGETGGAQVVIEKYSTPGEADRFEVYVSGTVTFSPVADTEPWDLTSNLANAAGYGSGSYASVAEAMRIAGIDEESPVQFTGYSQGGGTAARLAASGDYNTQGLTTFGGPTGQVVIPDDFPSVLVEHSDDIVPALGGQQLNTHAVLVERDVFAGEKIPTEYAVPAHHREYYQRTAELMDAADSSRITEALAQLDSFGSGATTVTGTAYRFERAPLG